MAKILFLDKQDKEISGAPEEQKVRAVDLNEIKNSVNTLYDIEANHEGDQANPHDVTKTQVGLPNVDNTADTDKPVSALQQTAIDVHPAITTNPHNVNKTQLGLENVNNTADNLKPVSTAQQSALDLKQDLSAKGVANGYASLDGGGLVPANQLPSFVEDVLEFPNLASFPVTGETGKIYVALDTNKTYRWSGSGYIYITSGAVDSVAGKTGVVVLVKADVGLNNIDNTSDINKPVSTLQQAAIDLHANSVVNPHSVSKSQVGLANADNTADSNKPVSVAQQAAIDAHANSTLNPHTVTQSQVGLSDVDNTSDADKPVSTAQLSALNLKQNLIEKGANNGYAGLDSSGRVPEAQLPLSAMSVTSVNGFAGVVVLVKADIGLSNVDNTSDANKPVSTLQQAAIDVHPADNLNPHGVTKTQINLANVDNTSDANKPVSTLQQAALDLKQNASEKGVANGYASLDGGGLVPANQLPSFVEDVLEFANLAAFPATGETGKIYVALDTNKTYRWSGSVYIYITSGAVDSVAGKTGVVVLVKADVGLANVDNTSDIGKPVSTLQQAAIDLHANSTANPHTVVKTQVGLGNADNTSDVDKPVSTQQQAALDAHTTDMADPHDVTKAQVGLSNVDNTSDANKPISIAAQSALDAHTNDTNNPHSVDKIDVGLSNVDNTSDVLKPVSTAQQAAINAHANSILNPHSVSQSQVGLSNVDNTSDADKPVSTLQQTALDGKESTIAAGTTAQFLRGDKSFVTPPNVIAAGASGYMSGSDKQKLDYLSQATAAGTNAYTATLSPAITAYVVGQSFRVLFTNANTATSTINLNTLGAKLLVKGVSTILAPGDIVAGKIYTINYDGTNFQVINPSQSSIVGSERIITPTILTANINNYNPAGFETATIIRVSSDANRDITGFQAPLTPVAIVKHIQNIGSFSVKIKNNNAGSLTSSRVLLSGDATMAVNETFAIIYDPTTLRWRALSRI